MLPCIAVRRLTKYEVEIFEQIALTSKINWDTYGKGESFSEVESQPNDIESGM